MTWKEILRREVDRQSIGKVAAALELSRATVSLVLSGKYPSDPKNVAERIMAVFAKVACPYLGQEIPMPKCEQYRDRPVPMSHAEELRHWRACYTCDAPEKLLGSGRDN